MAPNTAVYIGDGVSVDSGAKDSLIWGSNVQLDKPGVFVFNMKNEDINYLGNGYMYVTQASPFVPKKEHTFLVNSEYGMIIGKETSPAASVQLTIGGAVKVGVEKCSADKKGLIFKEKNCLCGC